MKRLLSVPLWLALATLGAGLCVEAARAGEPLTLQAQLVWATDERPTAPKHPPVDPDLEAKLKNCAFRWTNYFEISRLQVTLADGETNSLQMSKRCRLGLKNLGNDHVEVKLFGQEKLVSTHRQRVAADRLLVLAGNADNQTAWLVVIKKIQPQAPGAKADPQPLPNAGSPPPATATQ
jgi:hypothetical protein